MESLTSSSGYVTDPANIVGSQNDGYYAVFTGDTDSENNGAIVGQMNDPAQGDVWVHGYNDISKEWSRMNVFVSTTGYSWDWDLVQQYDFNDFTPHWMYIGTWTSDFNYIKIEADGVSSGFMLDSVAVVRAGSFYNLTVCSSSNGNASLASGVYPKFEGTVVPVTANPDPGYVLDYWSLDSTPAGSSQTIYVTMGNHHTLQPVFRPALYYNLTITNDGHGSTSPSGVITGIMEGTYYYVAAGADSGYWFDYWKLDGYYYSSNSQVSVLMDGNHTLEALFVVPSCNLTVQAIDWYAQEPLEVPVDIDYSPNGTTEFTVNLPLGTHTITVPQIIEYGLCTYMVYMDGDFLYYGAYEFEFTLTQDTHTITFYYIVAGK